LVDNGWLEGLDQIMRPKPGFDGGESAVLREMYEVPDGTYNTYSLALQISGAKVMTPEAVKAVTDTKQALERLIVKGLVRGKRDRNNEGIFYTNLKLTIEGERAAIRERDQVAAGKKAMDDAAEGSASIVEMLNKTREEED
jgi:hypothetical protein